MGITADDTIIGVKAIYETMVRSAMCRTKKKGNHIDCPNRHWFAGESYTLKIDWGYPKVKSFLRDIEFPL